MKKLITILVLMITVLVNAQSVILSEDTTVSGTQIMDFLRTNGYDYTVVDGDLIVNDFIMLNGGNGSYGGYIHVSGNVTTKNAFFFDAKGTIRADGGVSITSDAVGVGYVEYCTFGNVPNHDETVLVTQNCGTLSIKDAPKLIKNYPNGLDYDIYNVLGQAVKSGVTNERLFSELPKGVIVLKVQGFSAKKLIVN
jgi:hypothetical protein